MNLQATTTDRFTVETDEADGFHYVVDTLTGARVPELSGYPLTKTANRAAKRLNERDAASREAVGYFTDRADEERANGDQEYAAELERRAAFHAEEPEGLERAVLEEELEGEEDDAAERLAQAEDAREERRAAIAAEELELTPQTEAEVDGEAAPAPNAAKVRAMSASVYAAGIVTREDWLNAAAELIRPHLEGLASLDLPAYRVTCGWPHKGGTKTKNRVLGQCWNPEASEDSHAEIFISPMETDPALVVPILAHELIHACLPKGTGHKGPFVKAAKALGFLAPFTQLNTSADLDAWAGEIVAALPAYPHARLNPSAEGEKKKQGTRMLKAVCEELVDTSEGTAPCGYLVRMTRKWVDEVGPPICPRCEERMHVDLPDDDGDEPEGEGEE